MPRYRDYHEELIEYLKGHDAAVAYLNSAWEESLDGEKESQQLFLLALRNVAEAQGGLGRLAQRVHIRREQLYTARVSKIGSGCVGQPMNLSPPASPNLSG